MPSGTWSTGTVIVPATGIYTISMWGGGGAGGNVNTPNYNSGGGAGACKGVWSNISLNAGDSLVITQGAGGVAGVNSGNGSPTTITGAISLTAPGGQGANGVTGGSIVTSGFTIGATITNGEAGQTAIAPTNPGSDGGYGGAAGGSVGDGHGLRKAANSNDVANNGNAFGGGGTGYGGGNSPGGTGGIGGVNYSYTVPVTGDTQQPGFPVGDDL